jgi:hypothetical protein
MWTISPAISQPKRISVKRHGARRAFDAVYDPTCTSLMVGLWMKRKVAPRNTCRTSTLSRYFFAGTLACNTSNQFVIR